MRSSKCVCECVVAFITTKKYAHTHTHTHQQIRSTTFDALRYSLAHVALVLVDEVLQSLKTNPKTLTVATSYGFQRFNGLDSGKLQTLPISYAHVKAFHVPYDLLCAVRFVFHIRILYIDQLCWIQIHVVQIRQTYRLTRDREKTHSAKTMRRLKNHLCLSVCGVTLAAVAAVVVVARKCKCE